MNSGSYHTAVNSSYETASLGLSNQTWYWRVLAFDIRGVAGDLSSVRSWTQISSTTPCNTTTNSGGDGITSDEYELGKKAGTFTFSWEAYAIPDQFYVLYNGVTIYTTGKVSNNGSHSISYSGSSSTVTIVVVGGRDYYCVGLYSWMSLSLIAASHASLQQLQPDPLGVHTGYSSRILPRSRALHSRQTLVSRRVRAEPRRNPFSLKVFFSAPQRLAKILTYYAITILHGSYLFQST